MNGKRNGKGYEFIKNNIIFKGEYLNGKRNGKGKEYDENGNLINDGEYLYRERKDIKNEYGNFIKRGIRGRGQYRYRGRGYRFPLYENEILNELKEGKGFVKEYDDYNCRIKFEGEYLNGERNGKGKEYDENGELIFEGEYLNGKKYNGKGKEFNKDGKIIFEFEYLNGIRFPLI